MIVMPRGAVHTPLTLARVKAASEREPTSAVRRDRVSLSPAALAGASSADDAEPRSLEDARALHERARSGLELAR